MRRERRRAVDPAAEPSSADALTAVRDLEASIATRRAALEDSRREVAEAERRAGEIRAEARARAASAATAARQAVLARARERAEQIRADARSAAESIGRAARAAEPADVAVLVERVLSADQVGQALPAPSPIGNGASS